VQETTPTSGSSPSGPSLASVSPVRSVTLKDWEASAIFQIQDIFQEMPYLHLVPQIIEKKSKSPG
jgi:hypothetical protein